MRRHGCSVGGHRLRTHQASSNPVKRRAQIVRCGAATVEFAIVANIMFVMVLTCIELARLNMVRNMAQDAAYFAARQAVVPGATRDEAVEVADRMMSSLISDGYTINVPTIDDESSEVDVSVSVDLHAVALFVPMFLPDQTIETRARMRTERYAGFFQQ